MADQSHSSGESESDTRARRLALKVSAQHAALLAKLREELGDGEAFAQAAQRLATEFGAVTGTAVEASAWSEPDSPYLEAVPPTAPTEEAAATAPDEQQELTSLYRPGHMRRRLAPRVATHHPNRPPDRIAVFDASGPGTRDGESGGGRETVLAIVGAALRDSIRIVDEAFRLEEDAICVLAPNLRTVEGVQMAERLLGQLDALERAGGLQISISAGVVACPDHGADAEQLLHKADAAMWRARAVGQPVGVGALEPVQDR